MTFLRAFLVALAAVLGAVAGVNTAVQRNWWVSPSNEEVIADILMDGGYVAGTADHDLRFLQSLVIAREASAPHTVVLGSSRAMGITAAMLAEPRSFNHGVASGNLLDYIAMFSAYEVRGHRPKRIVIGVDPWVFKPQARLADSLRPFEAAVHSYAANLGIDLGKIGWTAESPWRIFSLRNVLSVWPAEHGPCDGIIRRKDDASPCSVRRPDGSLKWPAAIERRTPAETEAAITLEVSRRGGLHVFDGYDRIDPAAVDAFRRFVADVRRRGIEIVFVLAPYHPALEAAPKVRADWALLKEAESLIRNIAHQAGITVAGGYSSRAAGCRDFEFYDSVHPSDTCMRRILAGAIGVHSPRVQAPAHMILTGHHTTESP